MQIDGTEILMELVTVDGEAAPRLAQTRPQGDLLASYFDQLRDAMAALARHGVAHGDLSPYNILAAGDRLVVIDLPQAVDIVATRPAWTSSCATATTSAAGSWPAGSTSTSTRCSRTCWPARSETGRTAGCPHEVYA